jgi:hypothetical protein
MKRLLGWFTKRFSSKHRGMPQTQYFPEGISAEFEKVRRIPASYNRFGIDIFDCRAFTHSAMGMSEDPHIAESFVRLRGSSGEEHRGREPQSARSVGCELTYALQSDLQDGPLFKAEEMEDKWDIYLYGAHVYFARSWTGDLIYRARAIREPRRLRITEVSYRHSEDPVYAVRVIDYLVKSHIFGALLPHPLPPSLPPDPARVALFSFAEFGRRCAYGSYADTTAISLPAAGGPAG